MAELEAITLPGIRRDCGKTIPTQEQWDAERGLGWEGSDGSSCSLDHIFGVEIGRTSADYCTLPADVHDFWYAVLRRMRLRLVLSIWETEPLRARADRQHLELLNGCASKAHWSLRPAFRARSWGRYRVLRWAGERATRPRQHR